jgi:hypothetical protein
MHSSLEWASSHRQYTIYLLSSHTHSTLVAQAYISGKALIILEDAQKVLQTIYIDDARPLEAVTINEASGRIAVCDQTHVYIYKPMGREERVLRVCKSSCSRLCSI